jgi:predicted MPP superfamily phosphohydrolase
MAFQLREVNLPILPKGSPELRVLHFSDLHLTPRRKREIEDIRSWAELKPDLVISTGDFLGHKDAINTALYALEPLLNLPGLYVFGSNDYYGPRFKNPLSYLKKDDGTRILGEKLKTEDLDARLQARGWKNLNTAKLKLEVKGIVIEARGTDDAHLELDDYSVVSGVREKSVDLSIGVTHAPYKRIIDAMATDKLDLIFAGHTHGGQVRIPWFGGTRSLTTNCDLPNWRSRGLTKFGREPYLHVSAGMGENKFFPIRILCASEVSLLKLHFRS